MVLQQGSGRGTAQHGVPVLFVLRFQAHAAGQANQGGLVRERQHFHVRHGVQERFDELPCTGVFARSSHVQNAPQGQQYAQGDADDFIDVTDDGDLPF